MFLLIGFSVHKLEKIDFFFLGGAWSFVQIG